jgi:hypothetical protein
VVGKLLASGDVSLPNSLGYEPASAEKVGLERGHGDAQPLGSIPKLDALKVAEPHAGMIASRQFLHDAKKNARFLPAGAHMVRAWSRVYGELFEPGHAFIGAFVWRELRPAFDPPCKR